MRLWTAWLLTVGCAGSSDSDDVEDPTPICDGRQQLDESNVDAPFDVDGDGFFDAANPDCAAAWSVNQLDCDDADPEVNPAAFEYPCNGKDDDCIAASQDDRDQDGDGFGVCEDDCDDLVASVAPGNPDTCFDGFDNDCDGIQDNDCGEDYNGTWQLDQTVDFGCGILGTPFIDVNFSGFYVTWNPPFLAVSTISGTAPSLMEGTVEADGSFSLATTIGIPLECEQNYTLEGVFTSADTFEAVFVIDLVAGLPGICLSCPVMPQSYELVGTKE
jgi:hypothetical protein